MKISNIKPARQLASRRSGQGGYQISKRSEKSINPNPQIQSLRDLKSAKERREWLEKKLKIKLSNIGYYSLDEKVAGTRNCENMIGAAQVPIGVAGPLKIQNSCLAGRQAKFKIQNYYIPLATTEGALVASVNRGCKAITLSGGVLTAVENVGTTRGPVFRVARIKEGLDFKKWLDDHFSDLAKEAQKTSSHLTLRKLGTRIVGKNVYVRFYFDTEDAMGMNMATIATTSINRFIEVKTGIKCISASGNFCTDKKAAHLNFNSGRGKRVWAEVVIKKEIIKKVLKTTAQKIYDVWLVKCLIGSAMSGSMGFNAHYANIIAALFIATGQDPAHVVEGSLGITTTEITSEGNLYISCYLPSLMVGTVGGGTGLSTQREALEILGVFGGDEGKKALAFAEIIAGAVLAGEISLLASLAEGSLARAHSKLARSGFRSKIKD